MWKRLVLVSSISIFSLAIFWTPFFARSSSVWGVHFNGATMSTIVQNFDGLNYLAVAKSGYDPAVLSRDFASFGNDPVYYASHFPGFPLFIRLLNTMLPGPYALLTAVAISNILLAVGLYLFFETMLKNSSVATLLTVVALFFPARMLSVRGVGSSEPLFMFFVLTSLILAYRGKHWGAAILGACAVLTRSLGILLFGGYLLAAVASYTADWKRILRTLFPYLLMPFALALLFWFYGMRFGNPLAYFQSSSELHPVFFPPFLIFSNAQKWVTGIWREEFIYEYLFYGVGLYLYIKKLGAKCGFELLAPVGYGVLYGLVMLLVAHQDLSRYLLPLAPVALLGYAPYLRTKASRWLLLLLIPIYLLGWQFVLKNVQPVSDWTPLL